MPDDVREALEALVRIRQRGAHKRQLGYLAKRMRNADLAPIEAALEAMRQAARSNAADHHLIEAWRDRLLGDGPGETSDEALTAFLEEHREVDRQALRQLQRAALAERTGERTPAAARQLFRMLRDVVAASRAAAADGLDDEATTPMPDGHAGDARDGMSEDAAGV